MSTGAVAGFKGLFYAAVGTATPGLVGEVQSISVNIDQDTMDATSHGSAGWKENLDGRRSWGASVSGLYVNGDTGQTTILSLLPTGTGTVLGNFEFVCDSTATSSTMSYTGSGYIKGFKHEMSNDNAQTVSFDVVGTGVCTYGTT